MEIPVQEARRDVDVSGPKQICLRPPGESEPRVVYLSVHHIPREGATRCVITARLKDAGVAGETASYVCRGLEAMGKAARRYTYGVSDFFFAEVVASAAEAAADAATEVGSARAVRDALLVQHVVPGLSAHMACALA